MPVFKIQHITRYEYDHPVRESVNEIRILPYQCPDQEILQQNLTITGHPQVHTFMDYWGNNTGTFNLATPHRELIIDNKLLVRTTNPPEVRLNYNSGFAELEEEIRGRLRMLELTKPDQIEAQKKMKDIVRKIHQPSKSIATITEESCAYIFEQFQYIKGITNVETTLDEILEHQSGVCQDFAHLLLQILRCMNIPSRYVSGYICPNKNGMRGEGATHAWVEAWIPKYGWAGIDPTNNVWVTNTHVKLAVGRNFTDCTPIKGTFKGSAEQKLSVYVSVGYEDGKTFEEVNNVEQRNKAKENATAQQQQ
ncbi:MAG TPA: transglutaminase family protein [Flavisolibacter sp.]|nr:transglutaminase family protein [Flavisolibacter sp.]